jgi:hypothetical protein
MVKKTVKENEIKEYLKGEGFKEVRASEKNARWYKKASEPSSCLKAVQKEKIKKQL